MKRLIYIMVCVGLLVGLAACQGRTPPPAPTTFSAEVTLQNGEVRQSAKLTQERPGMLRLEFSTPESLAGMGVFIEGDMASLQYDGLVQQLAAAALPRAGAASLLNQVLLQLAQPPAKGQTRSLRSGGWERKGEANGLHYTAKLSEEGCLRGLEVPEAGLEIRIEK